MWIPLLYLVPFLRCYTPPLFFKELLDILFYRVKRPGSTEALFSDCNLSSLAKADLFSPPSPHPSTPLNTHPHPLAESAGVCYMDGQERGWLAANRQTWCRVAHGASTCQPGGRDERRPTGGQTDDAVHASQEGMEEHTSNSHPKTDGKFVLHSFLYFLF